MADKAETAPKSDRKDGRFKPGQSGNPTGRPAVIKTIQALAREHTPEAIEALVAALEEKQERVHAAKVLLAYGYGAPVQNQNVRVIRSIEDLSDAELAELAGIETEGTHH